MKWVLYTLVFVSTFSRSVYGLKVKQVTSITIESNSNFDENAFLEAGTRKTITCKASHQNQKLEWIDPNGEVVNKISKHRIFAQEISRQSTPSLILIFTHAAVKDTGVWECRSDGLSQNMSLCVIDPSEFVDTNVEVSTNRGRSITLVCQARGDPEPRLIWLRNGAIISDDDVSSHYRVTTKYNSQGFEGLLTIMSVEPEDSGIYTCSALQENTLLEDCVNTETLNITLNVDYAPEFDVDEIVKVYAKYNQSVDLICAANGYPPPTYRWFKEISKTLSEEYPQKSIKFVDDKAILSLKANDITFGEKFKCRATNAYGDAYKEYILLSIQSPNKPIEIHVSNYTEDSVQLNLTWSDETFYPVDAVLIQYLNKNNLKKKNEPPRALDWRRAKHKVVTLDEPGEDAESFSVLATLKDLDIESEYWVRVRAINGAGESPWSDYVEVIPQEEEEESTEEPQVLQSATTFEPEGLLYGFGFTAIVIVVAVGCMLLVKLL